MNDYQNHRVTGSLQPSSPLQSALQDHPPDRLPSIERYAHALTAIATANSKPSDSQLLDVLLARDAVQSDLQDTSLPTDTIAQIIALDNQLRQQADAIAATGNLNQWRTSVHPPAQAWWWFLESSKQPHPRDRWDWIWNILTASCLVYTASCVTAILQPFVVGGLTVAEAAAMIAEGAGLLLITKGAFTEKGKETVKRLLTRLHISPQWYSEASFGFSVVLLLITVSLHASLPRIGKFYLQQGLDYHSMGLLGEARRKFEKALELNPQKASTHLALGELDESLGALEEAETHYQSAFAEGNAVALSGLGRVYLAQDDPVEAETKLRLGLKWVQDPAMVYQLNRNLGRALLEQEKYAEAQQVLHTAIAQEQHLPEYVVGRGMANCFLSQALEAQGNQAAALPHLQVCQEFARPETVDEYRWLIETGLREVADQADTTAIVNR